MTRIAALIAASLWLAACAAPVAETVGQCEPGVDQIATQAGSVLCPS